MNEVPLDISAAVLPSREMLGREYILGGASYGDILRLAASIVSWSSHKGRHGHPLCLGTSSKALLMAAVIASLDNGPGLVVPASLSGPVIAEACAATRASAVLTDRSIALPKGIHPVPLHGEKAAVLPWRLQRETDKPFLWLYTGGSTGAPRLWPKTPNNLIGEALNLRDVFAIGENDVLVSTVPPLHIYGLLFSVLLPFVAHARVSDDTPYFPREIVRAVDRARATVLIGSPMHYRSLSASSFRMKHLRRAFSSGGFLEEADSLHFTCATGAGVSEIYGSTETGGVAIRCRAEGQSAWQPFSCVRWMMNRGRLAVSSPFLSPNLRTNKEGFFTTGDVASDFGDGTFLLHGRADGIVKIGGKRVNIAAIEQKIKSLSYITDAWVLSLPSRSGREHDLAVLIVTKRTPAYLRKVFARILEPTHLPRRIVRVPSIPTAPSGKRDHRGALLLLSRQEDRSR
ncbi:MAG: AMP-binding protein [Deltaproteobacteria bacterium]|nr:AMP-binding protein [Deltaproteobacteria bacterium]MCL5277995.1 AMP-binding protein [Deltaproteobacteria bacterium]